MKEDYQKAFKKLSLFFLSNPVPFNGQSYQKQKGSGTSDQSLFRLQNKFKNIPWFVILSDQVWWCNVTQFLSYFKIYIYSFMQANSWHHKLFHFLLPLSIWKLWKGREKMLKIWIPQERKDLFGWNKKHFPHFYHLNKK